MNVAGLVLGIVGTVLAVLSLGWQAWSFFFLQRPRPKLTPIVGFLTEGGILTNVATRDVRATLPAAADHPAPGRPIVGVKVVNAGRTTFHVAEWQLRADPHGVTFSVLADQIGSPSVPRDITPGAQETFFMHLDGARNLASACEGLDGRPQQIVVTVSTGGRTYVSEPVAPANLTIDAAPE